MDDPRRAPCAAAGQPADGPSADGQRAERCAGLLWQPRTGVLSHLISVAAAAPRRKSRRRACRRGARRNLGRRGQALTVWRSRSPVRLAEQWPTLSLTPAIPAGARMPPGEQHDPLRVSRQASRRIDEPQRLEAHPMLYQCCGEAKKKIVDEPGSPVSLGSAG